MNVSRLKEYCVSHSMVLKFSTVNYENLYMYSIRNLKFKLSLNIEYSDKLYV